MWIFAKLLMQLLIYGGYKNIYYNYYCNKCLNFELRTLKYLVWNSICFFGIGEVNIQKFFKKLNKSF